MDLTHIDLAKLSVSPANMRHGRKQPDLSDILPSIRARGILVPLLVRPNGSPETYEIVAGRRRYFAARTLAEETGGSEPLPCAVMAPGDDAAALEASLIENLARLDPDEVTQWETFVRLIREGRSVADLSATFGMTEIMVKRRLALGNLLPKIRDTYRKGDIDADTVRHLTLATKARQKDWLALFNDPLTHAPRGHQLKQWLFGGQFVATTVALFPLEDYSGEIVADLFGEHSYFADVDLFWSLQNAAVAAKRDAYLAAGWGAVEVLEPGQSFHSWEYEKTPRKKGGKVFITVSHRGEVETHEGFLTTREARRARDAEADPEAATVAKPARPEVTSTLQSYIDLHRHAAVRLALLDHPGVALRLMVAHAIAGSGLWSVHPEPQRAGSEMVAASLAASPLEAAFDARRSEVLALLDFSQEESTVAGGHRGDTSSLFLRLLGMPDEDVFRILALVMGETLEAGSAMVEAAGVHLKVDMTQSWQADDAFFDLIRDKAVIHALLAEVAGKAVADANIAEKGRTQKQIVRDCLDGANGRAKVENWLPGWLAFPVRSYTERGGIRAAHHWAQVSPLMAAE
ncbi:MAG: ParB/RepB/Spo0J family partition protein [Magnetospirillum sp.]|nr:ParB/RepB/Spo0J family partition protein [Magnetospirillum sp.]